MYIEDEGRIGSTNLRIGLVVSLKYGLYISTFSKQVSVNSCIVIY
jgi:hypothetical protein